MKQMVRIIGKAKEEMLIEEEMWHKLIALAQYNGWLAGVDDLLDYTVYARMPSGWVRLAGEGIQVRSRDARNLGLALEAARRRVEIHGIPRPAPSKRTVWIQANYDARSTVTHAGLGPKAVYEWFHRESRMRILDAFSGLAKAGALSVKRETRGKERTGARGSKPPPHHRADRPRRHGARVRGETG
jgi:hypothetical protein